MPTFRAEHLRQVFQCFAAHFLVEDAHVRNTMMLRVYSVVDTMTFEEQLLDIMKTAAVLDVVSSMQSISSI